MEARVETSTKHMEAVTEMLKKLEKFVFNQTDWK